LDFNNYSNSSCSFSSCISSCFSYRKIQHQFKQKKYYLPFFSLNYVQLINAAGTSQIDCSSVGGKINIIGAWAEVIDSYGECTGQTSGALNLTCGLKGAKIACKADTDCGPGMSCAGEICVPATCPASTDKTKPFDNTKCSCGGNYCPVQPGKLCSVKNAGNGQPSPDCNDPGTLMYCDTSSSNNGTTGVCAVNPGQSCMAPDPFSGQYCALYPLCSNAVTYDGKSMENKICGPKNTNTMCRPRDASAYLSGLCDGQTTCNLTFDPKQQLSGFGTSPCNSEVNPGSNNYNNLPTIPGQGGNYNQGYYVHGIYTCTFDS
jgi:hypothetical protein